MEDVQEGQEPTSGLLRWRAAALELVPEKSLTRIATNARFLTATVATAATALTAFGLVAPSKLLENQQSRTLAVVAVVAVLSSLFAAILCLVLRASPVNLDNLEDVKRWYGRELGKTRLLTVSGFLLLLGLLAASTAGLVSAFGPDRNGVVTVELFGTETDTRKLEVSAEASGIAAGSFVILEVTYSVEDSKSVVYRGTRQARGSELLQLGAVVDEIPIADEIVARLSVDGDLLSEASISG